MGVGQVTRLNLKTRGDKQYMGGLHKIKCLGTLCQLWKSTLAKKENANNHHRSFKFSFMKKIVSFKDMKLRNKKKKTALMMLYVNKYDWSGLPAFKSLGYLSQSLLLLQHQHAESELNTSNHSCDRADVRVPRHKFHTHFWLGWSKNEKSNF